MYQSYNNTPNLTNRTNKIIAPTPLNTPQQQQQTISTPSTGQTTTNNILKSPSFPFISRSWELNTFDSYMKFRSHYVKVKSTSYLVKSLVLLVLSVGAYCYIFEASQLLHVGLFYAILIGSSTTLGLGSAMLAQHFQPVPEVILSEEQRELYKWPDNFPSSPPPSSSSSSTNKHNSLLKDSNRFSTIDSISPYKPNNLTVKSNTTTNPTISPITTSTTSPITTTASAVSPNDSVSPSSPLTSNKTNNNYVVSTTNTPTNLMTSQTSPITSPYSYRSKYTPPKTIESRENEEMSNNFQGRLFTSLSDFITSQFEKENDINDNEKLNNDKDKKIFEIEPLSRNTFEALPIQSYRVLQKSKIIEPTKVSYEEMVASKYILWKKMCETEHLYNMISAANACSRWFTENVIRPLVVPAESFLSIKDGEQLLYDDQRLSKCNFANSTSSLDIMKSVLKHTIHHLDRWNDVHHKKESEHICKRIQELSKDGYVFHIFGNKSNDQNDLQQPTDEQLLFALFLTYMDEKLYKDVTAPIPDLPFSSKYVKDDNTKQVFKFVPLINITYKRPLHLDIFIPQYESFKLIDISPGLHNVFFTIVLFFYYIKKYNDGYIDNMDISKLNVNIFLNILLNNESYDESDEEDSFL